MDYRNNSRANRRSDKRNVKQKIFMEIASKITIKFFEMFSKKVHLMTYVKSGGFASHVSSIELCNLNF